MTRLADTKRISAADLKNLTVERSYVTLQRLPAGSLQANRLRSGVVMFWMRYTHAGKTKREKLGSWDPFAAPNRSTESKEGLSINAAILKAESWAVSHLNTKADGGRPAELAKAKAKAQAEKALEQASQHSLRMLCNAYIENLRQANKPSWKEAKKLFEAHVFRPWPKLAAKPAISVSTDDVLLILRRVSNAGHARTMGKLRTYLNSAFNSAKKASRSVTKGSAFSDFHIQANPVEDTHAPDGNSKSNKNPLRLAEMRRYWRILQAPGPEAAVLRVQLLLCGARPEQFVKLLSNDVDSHLGELTLIDNKGRRMEPAPYILPMLKIVADEIQSKLRANTNGPYVFSLSLGRKPLSARTLATWAKNLVKAAPAELQIANFQLRRVRSGVETLLAEALVPSELRGAMQSHGLSSIQQRHYNGAEWREPKRKVLQLLLKSLGKPEMDAVAYFKGIR